jgi:hypothetical protein
LFNVHRDLEHYTLPPSILVVLRFGFGLFVSIAFLLASQLLLAQGPLVCLEGPRSIEAVAETLACDVGKGIVTGD